MWIVIEATAKYSLRARTVGDPAAGGLVGCMLVVLDAEGGLSSSQFVPGFTAEMIQAGW